MAVPEPANEKTNRAAVQAWARKRPITHAMAMEIRFLVDRFFAGRLLALSGTWELRLQVPSAFADGTRFAEPVAVTG